MPRFARRLTIMAVIAAALCALLPAVGSAAPAGGDAGSVSIAGRWMIDGSGRVITVHGENVVDKTPPYTPAHYGLDDADLAFLQSNGYNGIRLGIMWEAVEPSPGKIDQGYLDAIRDVIARAWSHGIYTLLEVHQDRWGRALGGAGAPIWATQTLGFPNLDSVQASQFSPAIYQAFQSFWANSPASDGVGIADHFVAAWGRIAATMAGTPGLFGFGILNEPVVGFPFCIPGQRCPAPPAERLTRFYDKVERTIRRHAPTTPIMEARYVVPIVDLPPPRTSGIAFNYANYALPCSAGARVPLSACAFSYDVTESQASDREKRDNAPSIISEFGATDATDSLSYVAAKADSSRRSWFHWNYGGNDSTTTAGSQTIEGILRDARVPPTGANINQGNLRALVRPYPRVVAGTPTSWTFDPATRGFTLVYTTKRVAGGGDFSPGSMTDISIPSLVYRSAPRVTVTGGRVVSTSDGILTVASTRTGTITVRVTP